MKFQDDNFIQPQTEKYMVFIYVYGWWSIATVGDRNGVYMFLNGCWSEDVCSWLTNCQVANEVKGTGYMFSADADEQFLSQDH